METDPLVDHKPTRRITPTRGKVAKDTIMPPPPTATQHKYLIGVVLLLTVVILWTFSSFITSDLLGNGYDKPFLITYLNTSAFSFYLLPSWLKRWRKKAAHGLPEISDANKYEPVAILAPLDNPSLRRSNSLIRSLSPSPALNLHPTHSPHASSALHTSHIPLPAIEEVPTPTGDEEREDETHSHSRCSKDHARGRRRTSSSDGSRAFSTVGMDEAMIGIEQLDRVGSSTKLSSKDTAKLAAVFCFAWFAANWSLNLSLGFTSVGSSTVLAGMSGFFTLGLGRIIGVETFSRAKVLAVCASFVGLLLVTQSDSRLATSGFHDDPTNAGDLNSSFSLSRSLNYTSEPVFPYVITSPPDAVPIALPPIAAEPKDPVLGDMLALLSALFYSIYVILLKVKIGDEENIDMQLFFGFVGLFNTLFLLPVVPILHFTGVETFELPTKASDVLVCAINMLITLSSDYLYVLAMLRTSPLVVTVGLSLTIPFAMLGDFLRGSSATITLQSLIGSTFVIAGFLLMGAEGWEEGMNPRTAEGEIAAGAEFALGEDQELLDEVEQRPRSRTSCEVRN